MSQTFLPIASTVLSSTQTTVTFSGISSSYTDLILRITCRGVGALTSYTGAIGLRFNGVSSGSYYRGLIIGDGGGSTVSVQDSSSSYLVPFAQTINSANGDDVFSRIEIIIPSYSETSSKPVLGWATNIAGNTATSYDVFSPMYLNSSISINQITISEISGETWTAGCRFDLYQITKI